jgi:hypothetical protein
MFTSIEDVIKQIRRAKVYLQSAYCHDCLSGNSSAKTDPGRRTGWGRKTEIAKVVGGRCIVIWCGCSVMKGLDEAKALYEWEYAKQLLYTQILKDKIGEVLEGTRSLAEAVERIGDQDSCVLFSSIYFAATIVTGDLSRRSSCAY